MEGVRKGERERAREGRGGEGVRKEGQELEREGWGGEGREGGQPQGGVRAGG